MKEEFASMEQELYVRNENIKYIGKNFKWKHKWNIKWGFKVNLKTTSRKKYKEKRWKTEEDNKWIIPEGIASEKKKLGKVQDVKQKVGHY